MKLPSIDFKRWAWARERKCPIHSLPYILMLLCLVVAQAIGGEFCVSTTGDDNNPGTLERPFKTFKTAIAKATGGDTVWIKGGVYQEPLVIRKSCDTPLVIKPVGDDVVIIRHTVPLPAEFVINQGVYSIDYETNIAGIVWDIECHPKVVSFLSRVKDKEQILQHKGGSYCFDPSRLKLYLKPEDRGDDPNRHQVLATFLGSGVVISGKNIVVEGITVELAASHGILISSAEAVTVRRCRVIGMASQWGFFYSIGGSRHITVEECTGSRGLGAVSINSSRDVTIRHCAFYRTRNHGILFTGINTGVTITDNILCVNKFGAHIKYYMARKATDSVLDYNCGLKCDATSPQYVGIVYEGQQLILQDEVRLKTGYDQHSICADPKFISTNYTNENLMTTGDSPCRNRGSDGRAIGLTKGGSKCKK